MWYGDGAPLIEAWFAGRSLARGLAVPVRDLSGALRVETATATERRRYLFARLDEPLRALAATIEEPFVALRVSASVAALRATLPRGWDFGSEATLMTTARLPASASALPQRYRLHIRRSDGVSRAEIVAPDGMVAAGGYAAETAGVFVLDRIVVDPGHRRKGLGRAVVTALGTRSRTPGSVPVLVATEEGRALYATLGWIPLAPYASATSRPPGA